MQKSENIVRYTAEELAEMRQRGENQTDREYVDSLTPEAVEASIDHEEEGEFDWTKVQVGIPSFKKQVTVRFDVDVIDWFRAQGTGYQTRMNSVLRSYVDAQRNRKAS